MGQPKHPGSAVLSMKQYLLDWSQYQELLPPKLNFFQAEQKAQLIGKWCLPNRQFRSLEITEDGFIRKVNAYTHEDPLGSWNIEGDVLKATDKRGVTYSFHWAIYEGNLWLWDRESVMELTPFKGY